MTTEAALQMLHNGDPVGALGLLGEPAPAIDLEPGRHAARGRAMLADDRPVEAISALQSAIALGDG